MSEIAVTFGIAFLIGYLFGVMKEKARWIEKYISSRRSERILEEEK